MAFTGKKSYKSYSQTARLFKIIPEKENETFYENYEPIILNQNK